MFDLPKGKVKGKTQNVEYLTKVAQNILEKRFPPSFIAWLKEYGQEVDINNGSGNFATNILLPMKEEDEIISVTVGAEASEKTGWAMNKDFIAFGGDGGENQFAFYTKFTRGGEYPVLMVSMDDEEHPYVLMATSFSGFVNTYVKLEILRGEVDDEEKLLEIAKELLKKHEPKIPIKFAEQLASWDWKFYSLKEIESKVKKYSFELSKNDFKIIEFN